MPHRDELEGPNEPLGPNYHLSKLLRLSWANLDIERIIPLPTEEDPPNDQKGWRAYYK